MTMRFKQYKNIDGGVSLKKVEVCENLAFGGPVCDDIFNCCDCGNSACGCRYCWPCNACETCKQNRINQS